MKSFRYLFLTITKRFFSKRNLFFLLLLILLSFYVVQNGFNDYNHALLASKDFQIIEKVSVLNLHNFVYYAQFGHNIFFMPAFSSILLSNPPLMSQLFGTFSATAILNIYNAVKDNPYIFGAALSNARLSDFVFYVLSLLSTLCGIKSMMHKEYIKSIAHSHSPKKTLFAILLSHAILITLSFIILFICIFFFVLSKGINIAQMGVSNYFPFIISSIIMLLFFFMIGVLLGCILHRRNWFSAIFILWILAVLVYPPVLNAFVSNKFEGNLSIYKLYELKTAIINDFEKNTEKKYGPFNKGNMEQEIQIIEDFWNNIYPKIEKLENEFKNNIVKMLNAHNNYSLLFPTTFYNLTVNEGSSRGGSSYLEFYSKLQTMARQFLRFYIHHEYYLRSKKIVNFIKGDENIFRARSHWPAHFFVGVAINSFYIIILFGVTCFFFTRNLYSLSDTKPFNNKKDMMREFQSATVNVIYAGKRPSIREHLYNYFSGHYNTKKIPEPHLTIKIDGKEIDRTTPFNNFVYIPDPNEIPGDTTAHNYLTFIANVNRLTPMEKKQLLFAPAIKKLKNKTFMEMTLEERQEVMIAAIPYIMGDFYLVDRTVQNGEFLFLERLAQAFQIHIQRGATILYLSQDRRVETVNSDTSMDCIDICYWYENIINQRRAINLLSQEQKVPLAVVEQ